MSSALKLAQWSLH